MIVPGDDRLITAEVCALLGIKPGTWYAYRSRGEPKGNSAPEPDGYIDKRTPYWYRSTIDAWQARRPRAGGSAGLPGN